MSDFAVFLSVLLKITKICNRIQCNGTFVEEKNAYRASTLESKTPPPIPPHCLWGHLWSHSWACWAVHPGWRGTLWKVSQGIVQTVHCSPLPCFCCSMATRMTWWPLSNSWSSWLCQYSAPRTEHQFGGQSYQRYCTGEVLWRSAERPDQTGEGWCECQRAPGSLPAPRWLESSLVHLYRLR